MKTYLECLKEAAEILERQYTYAYIKQISTEETEKLFNKAADIYSTQSNSHKHGVSGKQPESETIHAAAFKYATKMSNAPDKETPDWIIQDFKAGAQWALSQVGIAANVSGV